MSKVKLVAVLAVLMAVMIEFWIEPPWWPRLPWA